MIMVVIIIPRDKDSSHSISKLPTEEYIAYPHLKYFIGNLIMLEHQCYVVYYISYIFYNNVIYMYIIISTINIIQKDYIYLS